MATNVSTAFGVITAPKSSVQTVRGNFVWASAGTAVFAAAQWGMVSILAKLGSPEMVGLYALGVAVTTPPLMLAQLNLRSVLSTDVKEEHDFRDYRDLRFLALCLTLLAVVLFTALRHPGPEAVAVTLIGLVLALQWMSDIYYGLLQVHERMDRIAISLGACGILGLCALTATVRMTGNLNAGLAAVLAARLLVFIVYDSRIAVKEYVRPAGSNRPAPNGRWRRQFSIFRTALPLGAVMMIGSLSPNLPRYFIAEDLGARALGIFSALASLTAVGNLLINSLGQASTPRLAKLYAAGNVPEFKSLTWRLVAAGGALAILGAAGAAMVGPGVLTVLFRPEYAAHSDVLVTLAIAAGAGYIASILGYAITACRCFREQVPLQLASLLTAAVACALLIPNYGLHGAAAALGMAPLVQTAGECLVLRSALLKLGTPVPAVLLPDLEGIAS